MAIRTTSIVPFRVDSVPDRFTPVFVSDLTALATTAGTAATKRLNRLQTASFSMATGVIDIVEMGSRFRPGVIDDLGELTWTATWNSVGIGNIAAITGTVVPTAPGASVTIGADQINANRVDFLRLVADNSGTVFGTLYCQDCVILDYRAEAAERGVVTETSSGRGPSAVFFPGFVLPKVYVATSGDVTAGYLSIGSLFSASEQPVQVFLPGAGQVPSFYQQNGTSYLLKLEKVPGGVLTNPPVRYYENVWSAFQSAAVISATQYITPNMLNTGALQVNQKVTLGLGTANVETVTITAVASRVNTNSGSSTAVVGASTITPASMLGIQIGVTLRTVNADGSNGENVQVTAVTGTTFTATFASTKAAGFLITTPAPSFQANVTKTHAAGDPITAQLTTAQGGVGQATYNPTTNRIYLGDTFAAGDVFRIVVLSYNTDTSLPLTIPTTTPDTTDRVAVSTRFIPLKINGLNTNRVTRASLAMTLRRDQVQGIGENAIVYGTSSVPDVAVDLDVRETDLSLLSQFATGSKNLSSQGGTIANDFQDLNYVTRAGIQTAVPASINLYDPFDASRILCTWSVPQVVVTDIAYASTARGDNTVRITARDAIGNLTVTSVNPI
jgi:hypothetical protein